jgi:hypothetical protein
MRWADRTAPPNRSSRTRRETRWQGASALGPGPRSAYPNAAIQGPLISRKPQDPPRSTVNLSRAVVISTLVKA